MDGTGEAAAGNNGWPDAIRRVWKITPQSRARAEPDADADDATVIQPSQPRLEVLVAGDLTAVDVQDLAGDVGRGLQEQDAVHHVADLAGPADVLRLAPVAAAFA